MFHDKGADFMNSGVEAISTLCCVTFNMVLL